MKNKKTAVLFLSVILLLQFPWYSYSETKQQSLPAERRSVCGQIDLERNMAYLASDDGTFSVIDIENPDGPIQTACLDIPDAEPVSFLQFQDEFVYLLSGNAVQAVDVSEPHEPVWRGRIKIGADQRIAGMAIDGQRLYLYDRSSIQVFSLADPASPVFLKSLKVGTGDCLTDIAVRNGIVYAAMGAEGVHIYFFKDLSRFLDIGRIPDVQGFCENIALADEFALIRISGSGRDLSGLSQSVSGSDRNSSRIEVMDVSNPLDPKRKGTIRKYGLHKEDNRVEIYKNMLILNDDSKRIRFIDLGSTDDDPGSADDNGQNGYDAMSAPICIKVREGNLYLLDELGAFQIARLDPSIFKETGTAGAADPNRSKGGKTAYITIDDGPSRNNTPKNLDTLKKYGVKATFFVLPREGLDDLYKRILEEGHVIGNHSSVHDYNYLYSSASNFRNDVIKAHDFIYKRFQYTPTVYRFPGGTMGRKKSVVTERAEILENLGYRYFDWDVSTADTDPNLSKYGTAEQIADILANNVTENTKGREKLIILMHDSAGKTYTAKALPKIIEGLQKQGYEFDVLTNYYDQ